MNVLHVIPRVDLSLGGPSRTSVNLVNRLSCLEECEVYFYSHISSDDLKISLSDDVVSLVNYSFRYRYFSFLFLDYYRLRKYISSYKIDLVHVHGVWHPVCHWACKAAFKEGIPYIIQPRGMLERWSLNFRKWKKKLALLIYQGRDLHNASAYLATAASERDSIIALVSSAIVKIIPNGVETPSEYQACLSSNISLGNDSTKRTLLFMSRIHPKKGIFELVRVWATLKPSNWKLRIVGPDDGGYVSRLRVLIDNLGISDSVSLVGPVYDQARVVEYQQADLFVLPSYSENFGLVVAEALSYGLPVLTTKGTPWSLLEEHQCGWWIDTGEEALVNSLANILNLSDEELFPMRARAKGLAVKFDWNNIARQTLCFYSDILRHLRK